MKLILCISALAAASAFKTVVPDVGVLDVIAEPESKFTAWAQMFKQEFATDAHRIKAMAAFLANDKIIAQHNAKNGTTFTLGHNQFSALTGAEFKALYLSNPMPKRTGSRTVDYGVADVSTLAKSVDWTAKGAVTPVKNQGQCGSCWAFSTTGSLEGAYKLAGNPLTSLSEQDLVSCASSSGNQGCNGGLMDDAFTWIKSNKGLCSEASYPYTSGTGTTGSCKKGCTNVAGTTVKSFTDVAQTENALMSAIAKQPVSIAIEADQNAFQLYSSGVLTGTCGTNLDHGVLAVGYGTQSGTDYFKVKNSWGASWGMKGYILLERGAKQTGGQCGILMSASYPTL